MAVTANEQFRLKGLREKRGEVKAKIEAIGTAMRKENRAMTPDEMSAFDKLKTDFTAISESIRVGEASLAEMDALVSGGGDTETEADPAAEGGENSKRQPGRQDRTGKPARRTGAAAEQQRRDKRLAFQAWARRQHGMPLRTEHKEAAKRVGIDLRSRSLDVRIGGPGSRLQRRALSLTDASGGYTVKEDFSGALEQALLDHSGVRGAVDEFTTTTGGDLPWPTEDDTDNAGEMLGEGVETAFADNVFSVVTFGAYKFTSKGVLISSELLNDSEFDLDTLIGTQLGIRIARAQGPKFTTGSGTSEPKGIVTCSSLGVTSAGATAITAQELTRLAFSVDRAYRNAPTCGYMMHDTTLAYVLLLDDGNDLPLLRESYRDGITLPILNGYPVYVNQYMAASTGTGGIPVTASKHVLFGDLSKFKVRDVGTVRIRRLDERYAEKDQVGFIGFMRSDSDCINADAIKHLLQA